MVICRQVNAALLQPPRPDTPRACRIKKKDAKRTQKSALALSKTSIRAKNEAKRTHLCR